MSLSMHVEKQLGDFKMKVDIEAGDEVIGLLGYSGCGKTMTLKMIAGLVKPDRGKIILNGKVLFDSEQKIDVKVRARNVGLMFQSYALFNHMTVYENIAIGMKMPKKEKQAYIEEYLQLLDLQHLKYQKPRTLSGGQKQRVALARILAQKPDILMLDEPFSALDSHLKFTIEEAFKKAIHSFKGTVLYISHNRNEIYKYCDQTAIMSAGKIQEIKQTQQLFKACETVAGARLTGCRNIAAIEYDLGGECFLIPEWQLSLKQEQLLEVSEQSFSFVKKVKMGYFTFIGVREGDLTLSHEISDASSFKAQVIHVMYMPDKVKIELLTSNGSKMTYTCSNKEYEKQQEIIEGQWVYLTIDSKKALLLKA